MLQPDGLFGGAFYKLFDSRGNPYSFDASITLRPGTRLNVTAYDDIAVAGVFETPLEVISISIASLPEQLGSDSDNNLLADDWEEAFHGGIGLDPYSLGAGGKTLVQLYLDGADPLLGSDTLIADLFPRQLAIQAATGGNFTMTWKFPAAYIEHFNFDLQSTSNLTTAFADEYTTATLQTSGDDNLLPLGTPGTTRKFWRLKLELNRGGAMFY
jgi:hypothetical protein